MNATEQNKARLPGKCALKAAFKSKQIYKLGYIKHKTQTQGVLKLSPLCRSSRHLHHNIIMT